MMEYSKWYWVLLTVLLIEKLSESEGCLEDDRVALLHLKSFVTDPYDRLSDWENVKSSNCCEWKMVNCSISSKRVTQLSIVQTIDQYGYLNASLFLPFTELTNLYLGANNIAGFVENEGPTKLGSMFKKLEVLDLSYNNFNDSILTSLSEITSLKSLNLRQNEITAGSNGFKPLSRLAHLEILNVADNQLKGFVNNEDLNRMSKLRTLDLSNNAIETFQDSLVMMNLEELDLSGNLLNNSIFAFISGLSNLKTLDISSNKLQGSIDIKDSTKQLKLMNLDQLDLSGNGLDSSILGVISGLSNLTSLNLGFNNFKGSIDKFKEIGSLRKLKYVNLDYIFRNETVSFLQLVEAFPTVKTISLNSNHLNKAISTQGLNLSSNVQEIFLNDCHLSDNILESIGALTSLKRLQMSDSSLTGPLPAKGWCDLRNLDELDLHLNALEGPIPPCFRNLSSLRYLDISNNNLELLPSFTSFANNSHLNFLFMDQNSLVREPGFQTHTKNPKLQLKVLSMSNCTTKGLPKQLPNFLRYQYGLRYVDLSYNNFDGQYPSWLLENNTRLQQFFIAGNSFKGALQLPKHANVEMIEIDLFGNKMQGQIPMNICTTFPHLVHLLLSQNAFKGNIPPCLLGGLKSLNQLDLSYNNFSGGMTVLKELGKSSSLWILRLSNNNLSGKIPPTTFTSSTLEQLYLDGNNFDGEIPLLDASTVSFSVLSHIDLSNNHLSGKLPTWIWNVSSIQTLVLSNNNFHDRIPLELCNLDGLIYLDLSQNNLFGSVPSCISSLTILEHLSLSKNKLSGPLPRALSNSTSLVTLDLGHNNFTGKIPNWISTLLTLNILILKANHFEGEIPTQICRLNSLTIIDLSQNKLFGHIPSCLSNLTLAPTDGVSFHNAGFSFVIKVLEDVSQGVDLGHSYPERFVEEKVAFRTKQGLYTYSGKVLKYMSGIDLSCNMLTGQIPPEIGNLSELHSLNFSHNKLVGCIPSTFSKLKQVESLDISHNKLSGVIPVQLMELNSLEVFNVSYNNLSGSIPHEKAQFATFDESSYLGNPLLCGPPKNESCTGTGSTPTTPDAFGDEEESGFLDKQVFYVTFVVSYTIALMTIGAVLYLNPYWRRRWFYFIGQRSETCYYFIVDNVLGLSIFRRSW